MEQFILDFLDKLLRKGMKRSNARGMFNKIIKDDLLFLLKDNPKYIYRIAYIIKSSEEYYKIKNQTDNNKFN